MSHRLDSRALLVTAFVAVINCSPPAPAQQELRPAKPNVMFIIVDDLRAELGSYGADQMKTPNFDRLAKRSMQFNRAYVQQAICCASRASFLTGCRPDSTGVDHPYTPWFQKTFRKQYKPIAQYFANLGYYSRSLGKVHHGPRDMALSERHFHEDAPDYLLPENSHGAQGWGLVRHQLPAWEHADLPDDAYRDGQIANETIATIRRARKSGKPFFIAPGFQKPHIPFVCPKKYYDLYSDADVRLSPNPTRSPEQPSFTTAGDVNGITVFGDYPKTGLADKDVVHGLRSYYACVSFIDAQLGKILDELERLKLMDSTLLVVLSDHGWHLGDHGTWGKMTCFERATRAPLYVRVPGLDIDGLKSNALVEYVDVFPTVLDLCGFNVPRYMEGTSFAPLLKKPSATWKNAVFSQFPRETVINGTRASIEGYSVRTADYRFTQWRERTTEKVVFEEFYDNRENQIEDKNLAATAESQALVDEHRRVLRSGWKNALPPGLENRSDLPKGDDSSYHKPAQKRLPPENRNVFRLLVGFDFNEGQGLTAHDATEAGRKALLKHTVWLNDKTFGKVLDFSTARSSATLENGVTVGKSFTIAAWIKAPPRETAPRVIASHGRSGAADHWEIRLAASTAQLAFHAPALQGDMDSGRRLNDGLWHHVLVTCAPHTLRFYVDGKLAKESPTTGAIVPGVSSLTIGAAEDGQHAFDGSLAQFRLFNGVTRPEDITRIKPAPTKTPAPRLRLKRGLSLDRTQPKPKLLSAEHIVKPADLQLIKSMGFDHVKVLLTPSRFMMPDGRLNKDDLWYVKQVVNTVQSQDIPCLICIHPQVSFKEKYLGSKEQFQVLLRFYRNVAGYIGQNWSADKVAFQLMTEPGRNTQELDWTDMADRMWGTVRNVLPDHTLITSSDRAGNIWQLQKMSPVTDPNVIYSFTTYEPYPFGLNSLMGAHEADGWRRRVGPVPYPASPAIVAARMDAMLAGVAQGDQDTARQAMLAYGKGDELGHYNRDWHFARARAVDTWRRKYGGEIHVQCVEFGCLDALVAKERFGGPGVSAADRVTYIRDIRESFEAFNIAWTYWSYNETFTVLNPESRKPLMSLNTRDTQGLVDADLLKALGFR